MIFREGSDFIMMNISNYPEFSWSLSRDSTLNTCPRKYYYSYYASHNGWLDKYNSTPDQRMFYQFKNVSNLTMCFGANVHSTIKECLSGQYNWTPQTFAGRIQEKLHSDCAKGMDLEEWKRFPKKNPALMEILYWGGFKSEISLKAINNTKEKLNAINNFFHTQSAIEFYSDAIEKIEEIDEDLNQPENSRFILDNSIIFAKVDFFYKKKDGEYVVVDWKTNKKDFDESKLEADDFSNKKDFYQLYLYADYINKKYGISLNDLTCRYENVITGNTLEIKPTQNDISNLEIYIKSSLSKMKALVEDGDLKINKPVSELKFVQNKGFKDYNCNNCPFKGVCRDNDEIIELEGLKLTSSI